MLLFEWESVAKRRILYVGGEHWEDRLQEGDIFGSHLNVQVFWPLHLDSTRYTLSSLLLLFTVRFKLYIYLHTIGGKESLK